MQNLLHVLEDVESKKAAVFDPAWDADAIFTFLTDNELELEKIFLTHSHHDHINALADMQKAKPLPVYMSKAEYEFYGKSIPGVCLIENRQIIELGQSRIEALFTPGHTPGGVSYLINRDLVCGDTLFVYGCGTCSLAGGNASTMFDSLTFLKNVLTEDTIIYPAHTYSVSNTSSWSEQLEANPFLMLDNRDDFLKFRLDIHDKVRQYPMGPVSKNRLQDWMSYS